MRSFWSKLIFFILICSNVYAADTEISNLTADATPGTDSLLVTIDDPSGTPASRKSTIAQVLTDANIPNSITIDLATTATTANAGDSATAFFSSGTIEHERGGLEGDISSYDGLVGITGGATYNQTGTSTQIIIFDGAGAPTSAALSGDATMTNGGVVSIAANAVALSTDTTGNYVTSVTNGAGITGGDGGSEGAALTLAITQSGLTLVTADAADTVLIFDNSDADNLKVALVSDLVSSGLASTDIDTYSELNTIVADVTLTHNGLIDTSAEIAGIVTDETGSGALVFGTSPTLTTPTISGAISFPDDVKQTFNPGTTNPGLNVGSIAGDPSTPANGDLWYDSTANELTAQINGSSVALGAGGASITTREITLLPDSAVLDDNSPPAISVTESTGTGTPRRRVADFDAATDEIIYWTVAVPSDADAAGTWTADIYWTSSSTTAGHTCYWELDFSATTEGDVDSMAEDAIGTVNTANEDVNTTEARRLIVTTLTITNKDSVAAGDIVTIRFSRDADNASDDLTSDARLLAVKLNIPIS